MEWGLVPTHGAYLLKPAHPLYLGSAHPCLPLPAGVGLHLAWVGEQFLGTDTCMHCLTCLGGFCTPHAFCMPWALPALTPYLGMPWAGWVETLPALERAFPLPHPTFSPLPATWVGGCKQVLVVWDKGRKKKNLLSSPLTYRIINQ